MTDSNGYHFNNTRLNFCWTNMTASAALMRLLRENHLTVEEEPVTQVPEITYDHAFAAAEDAAWFNGSNVVPLIQFEHVPITSALKNLAQVGRFNYMFDPALRYGELDSYGEIIAEPAITLQWTNVAAEQAFSWICFKHRLIVARDPHNGVILVRYKGHDVDLVSPEFYGDFHGTGADIIPLIEFNESPISDVLKALARQAGMKCILSPRIDTGHPADETHISLRWQNLTAPQAFAAVCESYDFDVIKYPVSGFIRVEPND